MSDGGIKDIPHFREYDGLRGYMAFWVAISHALNIAGYPKLGGWLNLLTAGNLPVDVFIILSGFVITHLLLTRHERYEVFAGRRFLRLFPMYLVACVAGYLIIPLRGDYVVSVPWHTAAFWTPIINERLLIAQEVQTHLGWHSLAHLTMLHGAIPREWLNFSDIMFLAPAWSISLEWQFYLLAPFIVAAMKNRVGAVLMVLLAVLGHIAFLKGWLGTYLTYSILPGALGFFLIGIATRLGWKRLQALKANPLIVSAMAIVLFSVPLGGRGIPLWVWVSVTAFILYARDNSPSTKLFACLLRNRFSDGLGKISYSLYLSHVILISLLAYAALAAFPDIGRRAMLMVTLFGVFATIPLSILTYRFVEEPGVRAGKLWAAYRRRDPVTV